MKVLYIFFDHFLLTALVNWGLMTQLTLYHYHIPASIQVESLITLAGITEMALPTHPFDGPSALSLLHKFDEIFVALCTGIHPLTREPLALGAQHTPVSFVTQTQKVRIRSLAETTRYKVFSVLPGGEEDGEEFEESREEPWVLEATRVYDGTLMLLADSAEGGGGDIH